MKERNPLASDRIGYLDAAKGIYIILVVAAHHLMGLKLFEKYIYCMGVTPYLLISGFLYAHKQEWERPLGSAAARKAKSLLYPYVTFSVVNLLWYVLYYFLVFPDAVPENSLKTMLLYTVTTYSYNALWYLPIAFWGTILFFALRRTKHHAWIWAVLSMGIPAFYILFDEKLTGIGFVSYLYCYLLRVAVAVVFIYAGSVLYAVFGKLNRIRENILLALCLAFCAVVVVLYQLYPEDFPMGNLAAHRLGNPYFFYPSCICNTVCLLLLCKKFLFRSRLLAYFGRNSLIVMALHMDVTIRIAWVIFSQLHMDFGEVINSVIIVAMELVMFLVIIPILNRFFPFVVKFPVKTEKGGR